MYAICEEVGLEIIPKDIASFDRGAPHTHQLRLPHGGCTPCLSKRSVRRSVATMSRSLDAQIGAQFGAQFGAQLRPWAGASTGAKSGSPVGSGSVCTKKPIATTTYEHTRMKPSSQCD